MAEKMTDKQKIKILKEKLANATKRSGMGAIGMASAMGMDKEKIKEFLQEARIRKPSGRINMDDLFNADKYKMKKPKRAPMQKGPNKMNKQKTPMKKALGPVRPIRERSLSKLTSRRRAMKKK
jgi:hypothetical protein